MENIETRIKTVMSAVFEVPIEDITDTSTVKNINSWDSLRHLNLILALEEEFNIRIPEEEIVKWLSYKQIELKINGYIRHSYIRR